MIFFDNLTKTKNILLIGNVLLVFALILLNNTKIIPLRPGDFLFFAFLTLAIALYRPGWCFLIFIGMLPLENVNLAPAELGINIRPYQFIGGIIILALIIRLATRRLSFKLMKPEWHDWLVIVFTVSGFLSIISAPDKISSFKLSIIISTFAALYFLVRNYIQNSEDLKRVIPFFLSSSVIVVLYGIWQNWAYLHNLSHFEVMPGRPNATFTEPDWLGMFLVLLLSVIFILIQRSVQVSDLNRNSPYDLQNKNNTVQIRRFEPTTYSKILLPYFFLVFIIILLILTVSRSAWLGAFVAYIIFVTIFFSDLHW